MARAGVTRVGIVGLVATALLSGALGLVAPASAGGGSAVTGSVVAAEGMAARALPVRDLNDKLVRKPRALFIKGNVNPGYGKKMIFIVRSKCGGCTPGVQDGLDRNYKKVAKVRTDKAGKFKFRMSAPSRGVWFWKAYAKKSGGYGKSWSNYIYSTYRI